MSVPLQILHGIVEMLAEYERLAALSDQELVKEALADDEIADHPLVEEMMNRLWPDWVHDP